MSKVYHQIISKKIDENGVHLVVKDKRNDAYHIEGHAKDAGNNALLETTPSYMLPIDKSEINSYL